MQFLCKQHIHIQDSSSQGQPVKFQRLQDVLRRNYSSHMKIQVLSLLCLRAVQPFSSNVKHNTDRHIASAVKESFISSGSFWLMATLTDNHSFTFVICYRGRRQIDTFRQTAPQPKFACIWLHPMALNICEASSFQLQMPWQDKSVYVSSFNGNGILPCCGTSSHVASHVLRNPTDSTAVLFLQMSSRSCGISRA